MLEKEAIQKILEDATKDYKKYTTKGKLNRFGQNIASGKIQVLCLVLEQNFDFYIQAVLENTI